MTSKILEEFHCEGNGNSSDDLIKSAFSLSFCSYFSNNKKLDKNKSIDFFRNALRAFENTLQTFENEKNQDINYNIVHHIESFSSEMKKLSEQSKIIKHGFCLYFPCKGENVKQQCSVKPKNGSFCARHRQTKYAKNYEADRRESEEEELPGYDVKNSTTDKKEREEEEEEKLLDQQLTAAEKKLEKTEKSLRKAQEKKKKDEEKERKKSEKKESKKVSKRDLERQEKRIEKNKEEEERFSTVEGCNGKNRKTSVLFNHCKKIGVSVKGEREDLIRRITRFYRKKKEQQQKEAEEKEDEESNEEEKEEQEENEEEDEESNENEEEQEETVQRNEFQIEQSQFEKESEKSEEEEEELSEPEEDEELNEPEEEQPGRGEKLCEQPGESTDEISEDLLKFDTWQDMIDDYDREFACDNWPEEREKEIGIYVRRLANENKEDKKVRLLANKTLHDNRVEGVKRREREKKDRVAEELVKYLKKVEEDENKREEKEKEEKREQNMRQNMNEVELEEYMSKMREEIARKKVIWDADFDEKFRLQEERARNDYENAITNQEITRENIRRREEVLKNSREDRERKLREFKESKANS